jgi:hypothetical protein
MFSKYIIMVLSATKRVSATASIANQDSMGGSKKAGLPHQVGKDAYAAIHLGGVASNGVRFSGHGLAKVATAVYPWAKVSRPIGVSPMVWH